MIRSTLISTHLVVVPLVMAADMAQAFTCGFTTECYEAEACAGTTFNIEVNVETKGISTDFGDLQIVAVKEISRLTTMFAIGDGAQYLITLTPAAARLSAHNNNGPEVISYLGQCDGAF